MGLTHHELCFGCGAANVFGLQIELERADADSASGHFFVKQDHQGPAGFAHGGILATALDEAMSLLVHDAGIRALTAWFEVELSAPAPVGTFVHLRSRIEQRDPSKVRASAHAIGKEDGEERELASARALFVASEAAEV